MYPFISFQYIEIGKIRKMSQQDHRHIYFAGYGLSVFIFKHDGIFLFDIDTSVIRDHSQHRNLAKLFYHPDSLFEQTDVSSEFINDNPLD